MSDRSRPSAAAAGGADPRVDALACALNLRKSILLLPDGWSRQELVVKLALLERAATVPREPSSRLPRLSSRKRPA
jgi:hypothetical protein